MKNRSYCLQDNNKNVTDAASNAFVKETPDSCASCIALSSSNALDDLLVSTPPQPSKTTAASSTSVSTTQDENVTMDENVRSSSSAISHILLPKAAF
jgi:hypothetical protein